MEIFCRKAYKKLCREIGEQDAFIELNELAFRYFIADVEEENMQKFIKKQSEEHGISVNSKPKDEMKILFAKNYIAMTYNVFEIFFDDFRKEYNDFNNEDNRFDYELTQKKGKQITRFQFLLNRFPSLKTVIPLNHQNLYFYFKEIRTNTTHIASDISKIDKLYENLLTDSEEFCLNCKKKEFVIKKLPNPYEEISFDDWLMFTKLIKSIALKISKLTVPSAQKIADNYKLKKFNKYKDISKKKDGVRKKLWTDFYIDNDFNLFEELNLLI